MSDENVKKSFLDVIASSGPTIKENQKNVLIGLTGSIATVKASELTKELELAGFNVRLMSTPNALHFLTPLHLQLPVPYRILTDLDEWSLFSCLGDPVLHIELRKWADLLIISPLDANSLAKLAHGLSDNLVTCVARAWDFERPFVVAPAMNTMMWNHPFTLKHLDVLKNELGISVVQPVSQILACGDVGPGAMAKPPQLVQHILSLLS